MSDAIETYLLDVSPAQIPAVRALHDLLTARGCVMEIKPAKSGPVASFTLNKLTVCNFIFRKKGIHIRIYGNHVGTYESFLHTLPQSMRETIVKASVCRRLLDPTLCSSRCPMGNVFTLEGEEYKKCRYNNFIFPIGEDTLSSLQAFLGNELSARAA